MKYLLSFALLVINIYISKTQAQEGSTLWFKPDIGDNLEAIPAVDASGNVYILAGNKIYSYTASGQERWGGPKSAKGGDANSVSVSKDNSTVYVPGTDGIRAFDTFDGALIWSSKSFFSEGFGSVVCESPNNNTLYIGSGADHIGSETEYIYAINADTGDYYWRKSVDLSNAPVCCRGLMAGCSIDAFGNVYLPGQDGILYSFKDDSTMYTENWVFDLGAESRLPVALDNSNGFIYACSNTSVIYKLNSSGAILASKNVAANQEIFAALALSPDGNTIYVNAEDAKLHALTTSDFTEKWTYTFEAWGSDPLVRDDGVILIMGQLDGAGRVCALRDDNTSGTLLWTSEKILRSLTLNETNVNIGPEGNIYVHSGDQTPRALFAIQGNGKGLSKSSPWPKVMGNSQNNGNKAIINDNVTETQYTLSTNTQGTGSIVLNPQNISYDFGTVVSITALPETNYKFSSWNGDLTGNTNPTTITMNSNKSITANFDLINDDNTGISFKIDARDPEVTYTGSWVDIDSSIYYLDSAKFTEDENGTAEYTFTGSQVKIFVLRTSDTQTTIDVSLDGIFQGEYSLDSGSEEVIQIYDSGIISEAQHTISFSNTSAELSFDFLEYFNSVTLATDTENIIDAGKSFTFNVYPNPVTEDTLLIEINGIENVIDISIIDLNGRSLITKQKLVNNSKNVQLNIEQIRSGIYFVKISNNKNVSLIKKIIVNK